MKPEDVLPDHMNLCRPEMFEPSFIFAVTNCSEIVGERIKPDIDDMALIVRDRYAPSKADTADGKVFETFRDKPDHFVAAAFGLNESGICFKM